MVFKRQWIKELFLREVLPEVAVLETPQKWNIKDTPQVSMKLLKRQTQIMAYFCFYYALHKLVV